MRTRDALDATPCSSMYKLQLGWQEGVGGVSSGMWQGAGEKVSRVLAGDLMGA